MSSALQIWRSNISFTTIQGALHSAFSQQLQCLLPNRKLDHNRGCVGSYRERQFNCVTIKLFWTLILYWNSCSMCQGAVLFTSQPRNQTIKEGKTVRFECMYQGSDLTPAWRINNSIHSHTQLPVMYDFNDQDFSLTVNSVPRSLNFTSFQCIVGTIFSSQGYLFVEVEKPNVTNCVECSAMTTIPDMGTTPDLVTTGSSESAIGSTINNSDTDISHLSVLVTVPILVTIAVFMTALTCVAGSIVILWKSKKVRESIQQEVEVRDNEAYAAIKPIKTDNNPAYEPTSIVANHSRRCTSPQA